MPIQYKLIERGEPGVKGGGERHQMPSRLVRIYNPELTNRGFVITFIPVPVRSLFLIPNPGKGSESGCSHTVQQIPVCLGKIRNSVRPGISNHTSLAKG